MDRNQYFDIEYEEQEYPEELDEVDEHILNVLEQGGEGGQNPFVEHNYDLQDIEVGVPGVPLGQEIDREPEFDNEEFNPDDFFNVGEQVYNPVNEPLRPMQMPMQLEPEMLNDEHNYPFEDPEPLEPIEEYPLRRYNPTYATLLNEEYQRDMDALGSLGSAPPQDVEWDLEAPQMTPMERNEPHLSMLPPKHPPKRGRPPKIAKLTPEGSGVVRGDTVTPSSTVTSGIGGGADNEAGIGDDTGPVTRGPTGTFSSIDSGPSRDTGTLTYQRDMDALNRLQSAPPQDERYEPVIPELPQIEPESEIELHSSARYDLRSHTTKPPVQSGSGVQRRATNAPAEETAPTEVTAPKRGRGRPRKSTTDSGTGNGAGGSGGSSKKTGSGNYK